MLSSAGGFWTLFNTLFGALAGGVLVALIKTRPVLKKIDNEREASLLAERAADMSAMRKEIAELRGELNAERAEREAERSIDRHRINNLQQCLDALLLMIETNPEKASEAAGKIRAMREKQMNTEAIEKATLQAARTKGAAE